jgi:O-antigen ligase
MRTLSPDLNSITECRLNLRGVIVVLLLTTAYFACFFYLPQKTRYLFFAGIVVVAVLQVKSEPSFWLPLLPLLLMAGGGTLPIGAFYPAIATIIMMAFTFYYVFDRILWNKPLFVPSPYLFCLFMAILIQAFTVFISIHLHSQHSLNAIRDGSSLFLFFPLAAIIPAICRTEKKFNQLLRAMLIALLAAAAIGVMQYFSITSFSRVDMGLGYLYRGRVASLFGNANIFAGYLEMSIPVAIVLVFRETNVRWKITAAVAVVLGVLSILYTFSRGGLICTFIGCGITLLYIFRRKVWIPVFLGIAAVFILINYAETFERQMSFFMNPKAHLNQPTILHRYVSYRGFFNQFAESPVTGVGWGAREFYWGRTQIYSFWEVRHCESTEPIQTFGGLNSLFLNHAVKGGIIALIPLLLVFGAIFAAFFRAFRKGGGAVAVAITAGIFSFMLHQVIGNQIRFPTVNSLFWFVSGLLLVLATSNLSKPNREERKGLQQAHKPILHENRTDESD